MHHKYTPTVNVRVLARTDVSLLLSFHLNALYSEYITKHLIARINQYSHYTNRLQSTKTKTYTDEAWNTISNAHGNVTVYPNNKSMPVKLLSSNEPAFPSIVHNRLNV